MIIDLKKYFVSDVGSDRINFTIDLSDVSFGDVKPFYEPAQASLELKGFAGSLQIVASVKYFYRLPCDRCLKELTIERELVVEHELVREHNGQDDERFIAVHGDRFDLSGLIRDDIFLDMPAKFLCDEQCKGLCPRCGADLNEDSCDCIRNEVDPRLEKLRQLID